MNHLSEKDVNDTVEKKKIIIRNCLQSNDEEEFKNLIFDIKASVSTLKKHYQKYGQRVFFNQYRV